YPGFEYDDSQTAEVLDNYRKQIFSDGESPLDVKEGEAEADTLPVTPEGSPEKPGNAVPATTMGQLAWNRLINGGWDDIANAYVFDSRLLTNNRPYFAAYVKPGDLPNITDRLDLLQ